MRARYLHEEENVLGRKENRPFSLDQCNLRVIVCVCVRERDRERDRERAKEKEREKESVRKRERKSTSVQNFRNICASMCAHAGLYISIYTLRHGGAFLFIFVNSPPKHSPTQGKGGL